LTERSVMRTHAYYTYHILQPIDALQVIMTWGSLHQERLNGTGYPFGYTADQLPLGARLMAVADVFTALTEDRPYRKGMAKEEVIALMERMTDEQELDGNLVRMLLSDYDHVNQLRADAQAHAIREYQQFQNALLNAVA